MFSDHVRIKTGNQKMKKEGKKKDKNTNSIPSTPEKKNKRKHFQTYFPRPVSP